MNARQAKRRAYEEQQAFQREVDRERRRSRVRRRFLGATALVVLLNVVAFMLHNRADPTPRNPLIGVPQHGAVLGSPGAPLTLTEYADMQCPFCGRFARDVMPWLIDEYVRPGKLQIRLHLLSFVGPASEPAARAVLAAGQQDRMFDLAALLFAKQRPEKARAFSASQVRDLAGSVQGLDLTRWTADMASDTVGETLVQDERRADRAKVKGTPHFLLSLRGKPAKRLAPTELTRQDFEQALDLALGR
jgi:protein-disulfide isomerase